MCASHIYLPSGGAGQSPGIPLSGAVRVPHGGTERTAIADRQPGRHRSRPHLGGRRLGRREHAAIARCCRRRWSAASGCGWSAALGRACFDVLAVCQKTAFLPLRMRVYTTCERFSRLRSRTRSMAAPRRSHDRTGARSSTSGASGHEVSGWQKTFDVRGHESPALSTTPPGPRGSRMRKGSEESGSGFRATTKSSIAPVWSRRRFYPWFSTAHSRAKSATCSQPSSPTV